MGVKTQKRPQTPRATRISGKIGQDRAGAAQDESS